MNIDVKIEFASLYECTGRYGTGGYVSLALLNDQNQAAWGIGACKEYVLDYTLFTLEPKSNIYYNDANKVYLGEVRLYVLGLKERFANALTAINLLEDALSIPRSCVQNLERGVLFRGHKTWFSAPPMLSLYALMIRSGGNYYELGKTLQQFLEMMWEEQNIRLRYTEQKYDAGYFFTARKGIECILKHGWEAVFGTNQSENWKIAKASSIHNTGICSFGSGFLRQDYPHWYKHMEIS